MENSQSIPVEDAQHEPQAEPNKSIQQTKNTQHEPKQPAEPLVAQPEIKPPYNLSTKEDRDSIKKLLSDKNIKLKVYIIPIESVDGYNNMNTAEKKSFLDELEKEHSSEKVITGDSDSRYFLERASCLHNRYDNHKNENNLDSTKNKDGTEITRGENIKNKLKDLYNKPQEVMEITKAKHNKYFNKPEYINKKEQLQKKIDGISMA